MIVKSQFVAQMAQTNSSNWVGPVHRPVPLSLGRMPSYSVFVVEPGAPVDAESICTDCRVGPSWLLC